MKGKVTATTGKERERERQRENGSLCYEGLPILNATENFAPVSTFSASVEDSSEW
jgi:hypothetical protein